MTVRGAYYRLMNGLQRAWEAARQGVAWSSRADHTQHCIVAHHSVPKLHPLREFTHHFVPNTTRCTLISPSTLEFL